MKTKLFSKKLPTLIALLIILCGSVAGVWLVNNRQIFQPGASPTDLQPQNIKITNISQDSFTVSFTTKTVVFAYLLVGPQSSLLMEETNEFYDNRDQLSGTLTGYQTHYITVANGRSSKEAKFSLQPKTEYYFNIDLGQPGDRHGQVFDNNGQPFAVTTAQNASNKSEDIISGLVLDSQQAKVNGALVYLSLPGAITLSDLTKDGRFVIPINKAFTTDLNQLIPYDPQATVVEIFVQNESGSSTVKSLTAFENIPEITLGQNYDLTKQPLPTTEPNLNSASANPDEIPAASPTPTTASSQTSKSGFNLAQTTLPDVTVVPTKLTITNPAKDNEILYTSQPEFLGKGPAGKVISLKIESPVILSANITIDNSGNWKYSPIQKLANGNHTLTVSYIASSGQEEKVSRQFVISASQGSADLPSFTATQSGQTPTPTKAPSPTAVPTSRLSPTPTSGRTSLPDTDNGVPTSGLLGPTVGFMLIALAFFGLSFITTKKKYL
jgi:hypothetical protein